MGEEKPSFVNPELVLARRRLNGNDCVVEVIVSYKSLLLAEVNLVRLISPARGAHLS